MSHPLPNLAVSPIYPIAWVVVVLWLILVIVLTIRGYHSRKRRAHTRRRIARRSGDRRLQRPQSE